MKILYFIIFIFCSYPLIAQDSTKFQSVDKEPVPINVTEIAKQIQYPQTLKDKNISGRVIVRLLIDEKGKYVKHFVARSPDSLLTLEVEKVLPQFRCEPAMTRGKPVKCWVTIPFSFSLNDKEENKKSNYGWVFPIVSDFVMDSEKDYEGKKVFYYIQKTKPEIMGHSVEKFTEDSEKRLLVGITENNEKNNYYIVESELDRKIIKVSGLWNGLILTEKKDAYFYTLFVNLTSTKASEYEKKLNYLREKKLVKIDSGE